MSNWQLSPMSEAQLLQQLRDHGLHPQVAETEDTGLPLSPTAPNRVITAEYDDLVCHFVMVGTSIIVRVDLVLDAFTPGSDFPAIMAANSVNSADPGARAAILHLNSPTPKVPSSPQASSPSVVLRVEHEIPVGPGLTAFQLSAALNRALAGLDRTLDAMVVELERLVASPPQGNS